MNPNWDEELSKKEELTCLSQFSVEFQTCQFLMWLWSKFIKKGKNLPIQLKSGKFIVEMSSAKFEEWIENLLKNRPKKKQKTGFESHFKGRKKRRKR